MQHKDSPGHEADDICASPAMLAEATRNDYLKGEVLLRNGLIMPRTISQCR